MSWIRMAFVGVAFLGVASVVSAQAPQGPLRAGTPPRERAEGERRSGRDARMTRKLFTGIELTVEQQDLIQKITETLATDKAALRPADRQERGGDEASLARMLELTAKSRADYRAILTPAQQVIYDKNVVLIKQRLEERAKHGKKKK